MNVEVLYFDACPSHEALLPRLRELMAHAGVHSPVQLKHIDSVEAAERERFLGAPTLRIDGEDVDPTASERSDFGLKCRLYPSGEGLRGTVPDELVLAALTQAHESWDGAHSAAATTPADLEAFARALPDTFPVREDASLAVALVRLLSAGHPVSLAALAQTADRSEREVRERLDNWPNVERDEQARVVGFFGLTLRTTAHSFRIGDRELHAWCAWDTLFLPALLDEPARVRSKCAVTGASVELVVTPRGVESACPEELYVTFPPLAGTDTREITSSFCCHVVFLAGAEAARVWEATHADGVALAVDAAYELGGRAVTPLLELASQTVTGMSR